MIRDYVTVERVIEVLNRLYKKDRVAMVGILKCGIGCNEEMVKDEDLVVQGVNPEHVEVVESQYLVGFLGIINAFFGKEFELGPISLRWNAKCPNGCELDDDSKFGEKCPVCGGQILIPGEVNRDKPFGDLRPAIREFREVGTREPDA